MSCLSLFDFVFGEVAEMERRSCDGGVVLLSVPQSSHALGQFPRQRGGCARDCFSNPFMSGSAFDATIKFRDLFQGIVKPPVQQVVYDL